MLLCRFLVSLEKMAHPENSYFLVVYEHLADYATINWASSAGEQLARRLTTLYTQGQMGATSV